MKSMLNGPPLLAAALLLLATQSSCSNNVYDPKTGTSVVAVVDDTGPDIGARDINLENTAELDLALQQPTIALRDDGGTIASKSNADYFSDSDGPVNDVGKYIYNKEISSTCLAEHDVDINATTRSGFAIKANSPTVPVVPSWTSVPWTHPMRC